METIEFLQIAIVGIVTSGLIKYIKGKFGTSSTTTKAITLGVSIVFGIGLYFLQQNAELYQTVLGILATASTFYAFVIKKETKPEAQSEVVGDER